MVAEIVEAVSSGAATSRAEIASGLGFSGPTAARLIGLAIRSKRLKLVSRDRFNSPTYAAVQGQPSAVVHEVADVTGAVA
ncbi:hypothetical protein Pan44_47610 [Caulifigura coniformis]|uniref:DprA winged helix domain-containing protein n=2 Tax=Caulifigura coniformis TaxID=2527983 RepID=A0A517SKR6_9PLAN|nr:hypothetical protein Pan44_47610 [Caulifigura coniformis]